jgi:hypothetical protein
MPIVMGLDISTSCTGLTLLKHTKDFDPKQHIIHQEAIVFKTKDMTFWNKVDQFQKQIQAIYDKFGQIETFGVESPLKRFASGASSASTVCLLQRFNGIVSYITRELYKVDPIYIGVTDARKSCGIKTQQTKKAGMNAKMQTARWMMEHDLQHINYPLKRGCEEDIVRTIYNVKSFVFDEIDSYVVARGTMNQL